MSDSPAAPEGAEPPITSPPAPARRRWWRRALWTLGVLLVVFGTLHTPPVKHLVGSALVRLASGALGAEVSLERLDYRLWVGEVRVEGVAIRGPRLEITCARAALDLDLGTGVHARVESPRVVLTEGPNTDDEPASGPSQPWRVLERFGQVDLTGGAVELRNREGLPWLRLEGLDAQVEARHDRTRGSAQVAEIGAGWPAEGIRVEGASAEAGFEVDPGSGALRVLSGTIASREARLEGRGRLQQIQPILASAEGEGQIDARLFHELAPALELTGRLDARVSFEKDPAGARGSLEVEVADLEAWDVGPWSGTLRGTLEGLRLHVDSASLAGYEGRAEATGTVSLGNGPTGLDVRATALDVRTLVRTFVDEPPPVSSRVDGELRFDLKDWEMDTLEGRGRLSFRPGEGGGWPLAGPARVDLGGGRVSFAADDLRVRTARVATDGMFSFDKDVDLRYVLRLPELDGLAALLADTGVELPPLALGGAGEIAGEVGGRLPAWRASARIASEALSIEEIDVGVLGRLGITAAGIEIQSLEAEGEDGSLAVAGFVPFDETGSWDVDARVAELRLTDALGLHGVPVPVTARGRARVEGPRHDPSTHFEIEARAEPAPSAVPDGPGQGSRPQAGSVPGETAHESPSGSGDQPEDRPEPEAATLRLVGSASGHGVVVDELTAALGGGAVEVSGSWTRDSDTLDGSVRVADVQLARLPWLPASAALAGLDSTVSGDADLSGTLEAPVGRLRLVAAAIRYRAQTFRDVTLEATLDGNEGRLAGRFGEEPLLSGRVAFEERWPLHLELELAALPLTRVLRSRPAFARVEATLALAGQASLDVSLREIEDARFEVRVEELAADLGAGGSSAGPFVVTGDSEAVAVRGFDLRVGDSRLQADGQVGLRSDAAAPLALHGEVPLAELAPFLPDAELEGEAAVDLQVGGRLAALDLSGEVSLEGRGHLGPLRLEEAELAAVVREGVLTLSRARVLAAGGELSAHGAIPIGPRAQGGQTLELEVQGFDPGTLLSVAPGDPRLVAPLDMSARVRATALALDAIEAEGEITSWSVAAGEEKMLLEGPARWRFEKGKLSLDELRLRGSQGHLGAAGEWIPGGAVRLRVDGDTDLALLNPLLGGDLLLSGPARVDLTVRGEPNDLTLDGGASLDSGRAVLREPPVVVSGLTGSLEARGKGFELQAKGTIGDGAVRAKGTVGLAATGPEVDVALEAEDVPLTFPEGLRSRSSAQVRLSGKEHRYRLEGDVTVHRALYDRETDFTSQSMESLGAELRALQERGSLMERVQLDLRVRLAEGLRVQNRQLRLVVDGGVRVGGDLLTPAVEGSVSLRDGGTVRLSRATMRLSGGRVELAGYPSRPPEIDITGRTQVTGIQIEVDLTGPLDDLRTTLSSPNRSDLTQADLATLLLTGRTAQAAADESGAIVAEEVAAALGSALNDRFGGAVLIDVSRDESLIVQDTDPTQRFNIGIPLGERIYLIYSQALDRSGVRWILDFRPTGQFRVRLISDSDDTGAIEVSHGIEFDVWSRGRRDRPETPEMPRVREIRFEGVGGSDAAELEGKAKLDAGDEYDFFVGEESARRMQEHLVGEGHRTALVEVAEKEVDEGTVDVVFHVRRGPRIEVVWTGDDPGRKLRKRLGESWDAYLPLEETAARWARDLRHELRARRYYQATVAADVEASEDRARVTFDVRRGPRGEGVDLEFEGNSSLADESLAEVLPPRDAAAFFAVIEPGGMSQLDTALRTAGARAGFLSLEVDPPREIFEPETGRLQVTIPIAEGERASLVSLDLPEEVLGLEGASPPELSLQVGEPFRIDAYVDDRSALEAWLRDQGFPDADLAGILTPVPGGIAVRFEADTGPRPTVGAIRQAREGRTRPTVVDEAVTLEPGDLIRPDDLAQSRDHLSETRAFRSVDVRAEATDDASVRDIVVDLVERPDLKVEYKVRYETGSSGETSEDPQPEEARGFQYGAGIEAANPFGWAHRYTVYGLVGKNRQLFGATFEAQTFFGRRWRTQVFAFDDSDRDYDTTGLTRRIRGVAFQQTKRWRSGLTGRRWHDRLRMQWGYSYRRIDYVDPTNGAEVGGDRGGVSDSLIGDTRDSVTDPHHGLFWTVNVEPVLQILGSEKDYVKLYGQVFAYVPLGEKLVWAQGLRIGAVPGEDPLLLLDRRFKGGGATTVRGFAENALGPQYRDYSIGGQAILVLNQEIRFPIWDRVQGGVFFDAGNVWLLARDLDLRDLRSNVGAGVRVLFPFGPVRLDWAWVLDPRDGEKRSRWVFALGHAF